VQPLAERLGEAFTALHPKVTVIVQGGGSSVGIKAATDGTVDIGASSRELKEAEKPGLAETVIARDGIAIIANSSQTVSNLTKQQIIDIFSGKITNWKEVGGADKKITVVSREEGSGTRGAFEELVMGTAAKIVATAILQPSNGAIRTTVAGDPNAIAYLSCGYIDSSVKVISVDGVAGTEANVKNGTYKIVRPLLFVTKGEPTGLVKEFIDFCLSDAGQTIVSEDYISVK
jgi:phosphate transport system substrate-binding protein